MTDEDVLPYARNFLLGLTIADNTVQRPSGHLNLVWRVPCGERSVIAQLAPPYLVADPDVPLDPIGRFRYSTNAGNPVRRPALEGSRDAVSGGRSNHSVVQEAVARAVDLQEALSSVALLDG